MNENSQREIIEFDISVSIGTQDNTYYYNNEFWDSILTILTHSYVILMYLIVTFNFYWN